MTEQELCVLGILGMATLPRPAGQGCSFYEATIRRCMIAPVFSGEKNASGDRGPGVVRPRDHDQGEPVVDRHHAERAVRPDVCLHPVGGQVSEVGA
jgi:hypothetical protein